MRGRPAAGDGRHLQVSAVRGAALLAVLFVVQASAEWHIKQVARLNRGQTWTFGRVVPYRLAPDSSPLLIFNGHIPNYPSGVYFYRYAPGNRYRLVKVDTGNTSSGFLPGNMVPWEAGDPNGTDPPLLLAYNGDMEPGAVYLRAVLYAPKGPWHCPDSVAWYQDYDTTQVYGSDPFYITDLDRDGRKEIFVWDGARGCIHLYENAGVNMFPEVWVDRNIRGCRFAFGDFDGDDTTEFATSMYQFPDGWIRVLKCAGDDRYVHWDSVATPMENGHDIFCAANLDGSGRAVVFVSFWRYLRSRAWLYTCEPTQGTRGYQLFLVDSSPSPEHYVSSCCTDIDRDGRDEVFWSCSDHILAYRRTGPHEFEQIWSWWQGGTTANVTACDVNGNGYDELIESGGDSTTIFEIEAIRVLNPNRRASLRPGDTCRICWETFNPPRCDSISLFLRSDTAWHLDTLTHGLPSTDTSWVWTVPDIRSDSCRIVAVAYGPGWQYDESDTAFAVSPSDIEERSEPRVTESKLDAVTPSTVGSVARIGFQLKERGRTRLSILDASGRSVETLVDASLNPGQYEAVWIPGAAPPGVYFLVFVTVEHHEVRKVTLVR